MPEHIDPFTKDVAAELSNIDHINTDPNLVSTEILSLGIKSVYNSNFDKILLVIIFISNSKLLIIGSLDIKYFLNDK